jgi:hypothetical protein
LKTITIKQKKKLFSFKQLMFSLIVLSVTCASAQLQNNEVLFIGDNGYVYVGADTYYFGSGSGQTTTTRTTSTYGKLIFSSAASTSGASDSHYLDGYGSIISTNPFLFPIGQSGVYAPARVTPSSVSPVDAAYYRASATTVGAALDATISAVSPTEYWHINGTNSAAITLTWRASSDLSVFLASTADLTIVGYNGTRWVEISSSVDAPSILGGASTMTAGSISTVGTVNLASYKYFSLGAKGNACPPLVAFSGTTCTWTGVWTPSTPTLADRAVISAPYANGSFACNSLVIDAIITLTDGQNIEIVNEVTGSSRIIMSSEASVVQRASGVTAPNIELTKRSRSVMRRYDYIYWGTPIAGNFIAQLNLAQASTATAANAFDLKYRYVSGAGGGWQNLTATETGRGFITRIKQQAPFTNSTNTDYINLKFTGTANNGDITLPITNNPASLNGGTSHVLLANPYPSALDAERFLTENTSIDGVLYIWTAGTSNNGGAQYYTQADYIAYTLAGYVVPNGIPNTFNGKIASGQGFKVKSLVNSGSVTFTNCMRLTSGNNQFFRSNFDTATATEKDRYKLNMTGDNGVFSQILVSYIPEGTLGYDRMYDAGRNSVSTAQLFSVFEGDGRKLAINARPLFNDADVVPIGVTKTATTSETFTVSITEKEGIFNTSNVTVYIHDMLDNTYHNLNQGPFTFTTSETSLLGRFEVVYQAAALSNSEFDSNGVAATISNNALNIKAIVGMEKVQVFDITGKQLLETSIDNQLSFNAPFNFPQAVYIVKVKLENGKVAGFKLINSK